MDQSGNNQLLLRASQSGPPGYNGYTGQHAAADRMRELLARTVQDHIVEERSTAAALQEIRQRLDDQYDRVRALESALKDHPVSLEEAVTKGAESSGADIMARIASLEDTVLTLAEALLRPSIRRLASPRRQDRHLERPLLLSSGGRPPVPPVQAQWHKPPLYWACFARGGWPDHSHSIVPGGLLVMSSVTRLTSRTSLVIRVEIRASTS
jgi:hypothetical protein